MQYQIRLDRPDGPTTETIPHTDAREAYDHCVEVLSRTPEATAVHLHLGDTRIHTIPRR